MWRHIQIVFERVDIQLLLSIISETKEKEELLVETLQVDLLQPVDHVQYEQPT